MSHCTDREARAGDEGRPAATNEGVPGQQPRVRNLRARAAALRRARAAMTGEEAHGEGDEEGMCTCAL